nr:MAG TPA: DNA adenine methylase [Caudoviricetes sp.]
MKYMGSKARLKKYIIPLMDIKDRVYYEPFAGGMNMIDGVHCARARFANDSNKYVIAAFKMLCSGWQPEFITKDQYHELKKMNGEDHLIGWAGVACSYSGKWFGGYAGIVETRSGRRDYQAEAIKNAIKQVKNLKGVLFSSLDYTEMSIESGSVVYCDPPYKGTTGYKDGFNSDDFFDWCRSMAKDKRCDVYVSEYSAPDDFECIAEFNLNSSLSANGRYGGSKSSIEKLFKVK